MGILVSFILGVLVCYLFFKDDSQRADNYYSLLMEIIKDEYTTGFLPRTKAEYLDLIDKKGGKNDN